jgi:hypothetical protein
MSITMQQKRGTASRWTSTNPILLAGEIGVETDTKKLKIGDGTTSWNSLEYTKVDAQSIAYTHIQNASLSVWTITHPLSFKPNVIITDYNGNILEGDIVYVSNSQITVTLSAAFIGYAYLS